MEVLSSASLGLAAVCFWQKDFRIRDVGLVAAWLAVAATSSVISAACVLGASAPLLGGCAVGSIQRALAKNWRMHLLIMAFSVSQSIGLLTEFRHFACVALLSGCVQLLRRPEKLKARLREWRIASGPLYALAAGRGFLSYVRASTGLAGAAAAILGAAAVGTASVALRPDNPELDAAVLRRLPRGAVPWPRGPLERARCHGLLMMLSMLLLALLLAAEGELLQLRVAFGLLAMEGARRVPGRLIVDVARRALLDVILLA